MRSFYVSVPFAGLALTLTACDAPAPTELGSPAFSHVAGIATGRAQLHPLNQSGIMGVINFVDDGADLTISGTATGLVPDVIYVSLIYDNGSVSGGPEGCEPTIFDATDPDFLLPTMFIGVWVNNGDGTGTLNAVNTNGGADYVPLSKFKTMSIRDTRVNEGVGPEAVVACGEEATHPAG